MKNTERTNKELLEHYENLCFRFVNYPHNKKIASDFKKAREEMEKRLGIKKEDA